MVITVNAPTTAYEGLPYSGTITVTGGEGPYHWGAHTGVWPSWLTTTANGATLTLSGTPTDVDYTWAPGGAVSDSYSLQQTGWWGATIHTVFAPVTITCNLPTAMAGQPYVGTITATGGDGSPFTWNTAIPGVTATANGGTLTIIQVPTAPGRYDLFVAVSDDQTGFSKVCTLVVN